MMTRYGTCYFYDYDFACRYYADYGYTAEDVDRKLREGEIHIGKPRICGNEKLFLTDNGMRYGIEESN